METNETVIEIENVCKYFHIKKKLFKSVDQVSLKCQKGKIYGLIGQNGAGKTTTIKMIVGLIKPTSGKINYYFNQNFRKVLGYVPEKPVLYNDMLPLDYLVFMGQLAGLNKEEASERGRHYLKNFELLDNLDKKLGTFSSGMKQKVLIAQALLHKPRLLILDEPTTALDPLGQRQLLSLLKALAKEGVTILISSHHMQELELIVDHIFIFNSGKIAMDSEMQSLKSGAKEQLEISTSNVNKVFTLIKKSFNVKAISIVDNKIIISASNLVTLRKEIVKLIINHGEEVISMHTVKSSLWDVVMEKIAK